MFSQLGIIYLLKDNKETVNASTKYNLTVPEDPAKRSQPTATVHDCSRLASLGGLYRWQGLAVPKNKTFFRPTNDPTLSPFPESYNVPESGVSTPFFRGYAATLAEPALRGTSQSLDMLMNGLNGPPGADGTAPGPADRAFKRAMREVLQQSATLDDKKKVIAECECKVIDLWCNRGCGSA